MANRVDLLEFLLTNPKAFSLVGPDQQMELAKNRPTPSLDIKEYINGSKVHFQTQWYTSYYWLTGSLLRQKLYCFICLLYGDVVIVSQEEGEFGGFFDKANDHQNSRSHIRNCELHAMLMHSQNNKPVACDSVKDLWLESDRKNFKKIVQLLYMTTKITFKNTEKSEINVLKETVSFLSSNEIVLSVGSLSNFPELMTESAQNEIVRSLKIIARQIVIDEITKSDFITAQIDIIHEKPVSLDRFSIIIRYVYNNNTLERFLTFFDIPRDSSGDKVFEKAYQILADWGIEKKLVCISYDIPHLNIVSKNINISFKDEDYIKPLILPHCNYNLSWIIWQSCTKIQPVFSFANDVFVLYSFFNDKQRHLQFIEEGISILPDIFISDPFKSYKCPKHFLQSVAKHYHALRNAISLVTQVTGKWDCISTLMAQQILVFLNNPMFVLMLCFFNRVFIRIDHLSCFVRMVTHKDIPRILEEIQNTISSLFSLISEESITNLWDETLQILGDSFKEKILLNFNKVKSNFNDIVVVINKQLRQRFAGYYSLDILQLVNFKVYKNNEVEIQGILQKYLDHFNVFNFSKLQNELLLIYNDPLKHLDFQDLLTYFVNNKLEMVFNETIKFLHFLQILPLSTILYNKQTKYQRVKRFAEFFLQDEELSKYDVIVIEKELLDEKISDEKFLLNVMTRFVKQDDNDKQIKFLSSSFVDQH